MKAFKLFFVILPILATVSCSKDDPQPIKTKTELLLQNSWKFSSAASTDTYMKNFYTLVLSDGAYAFKEDHSYLLDTPLAMRGVHGTWKFSADCATLLLDEGTSKGVVYVVSKLDAKAMELTMSTGGLNGNSAITLKFVKK